ncbi:PolC-type DNA polymerase III N-terminal domain-containing protein, partial [Enterococcus faecalis]|uniref:PolC-type DNA polymerase III N-terminal domain-containing protein n=1 Tax=Enterococcus faecalis TaxID=1351 RepID=UPI003D6C3315
KACVLYDKLMTQIQLDDTAKEHPLIQNGRIDKVIVHQQSRLWEFHLSFDELVPVMLYQTFMQQLELAFQQITHVSAQITTSHTTFTR